MKTRKICVVTSSRAEYGLLYWLMKGIKDDPELDLKIVATGMHLSPEFGLTYKEIEKDHFQINRKVEMILSSDTSSGISKSTGLGIIGFSEAFSELKPDIVIVLGDRFEILSASISAMFFRIPIGHIHGGETTFGVFDEAIRHSITKMAWWHFPATEEYRKRIIQLGEDPDRVFMVGGMGVDCIKKTKLLSKTKLEKSLGFKFWKKNLLVTYHPVTLEKQTSKSHFKELLWALDKLNDTKLIFTSPNADTDGRLIKTMLEDFVSNHQENSIVFQSMGRLNYLSSMQFVDAVVGNSSSGLTEAPSFKIGTINIGERQKGRIKASSIIDCDPLAHLISNALSKLYTMNFKNILKNVTNIYGDGNASSKIIEIIKTREKPKSLKKTFYDY